MGKLKNYGAQMRLTINKTKTMYMLTSGKRYNEVWMEQNMKPAIISNIAEKIIL